MRSHIIYKYLCEIEYESEFSYEREKQIGI